MPQYDLLKATLILVLGSNFSKKELSEPYFFLSNFAKQDKMKVLEKFKTVLFAVLRTTLNFQK